MGAPRYKVSPLYDENGKIAPQFLDEEFSSYGHTWEESMDMPWFQGIIKQELAAEKIADQPLECLADLAPSERVKHLYLHWLRFMDDKLDPWTTGGAIHFRPHWARVLMLALTLGDAAGLNDADMNALAMAAVFHDSRRKNPYMDTGHGRRASDYYREAGSEGLLTFDPRTFLAVRWHDRDDDDGVNAIEGEAELLEAVPNNAQADASFVYLTLKDADGLDRFRLGEGCFDRRFMRSQAALENTEFARELLELSKQPMKTPER